VRNDDQHPFPCEERKRVYIYEREVGRLLALEGFVCFALAANSGGSLLLLLMVSAALLRPLSSSSFSSTSPIPDINCVCSYCLLRPADEGKDVKRIRYVPKTKKGKKTTDSHRACWGKKKPTRLAENLQCGGNENKL
jgi:hypothetical protein